MTRTRHPARPPVRFRVLGLLTVIAVVAGLTALAAPQQASAATARPAASSDSPAGFWYGTDSRTITISGSAPYMEPAIGGSYGGYIGMIGNWARRAGCGKIWVWSYANSQQANANYFGYHKGIGTGVYWFMGGPGVDPHYNGTASEAYAWGARQAAWTVSDISQMVHKHHRRVPYPVVFMDVEIPGHAPSYTPANDNGWNTVYTSACSGVARSHFIPAVVDRAVINGFASYLTSHSAYRAGVYSAPAIWTSIFGSGAAASIPNTYEWTYASFTSSLSHHPQGWCLRGTSTCAHFFGGQTARSAHALMWQWSGGGGSSNGYGDFDQIDAARTPGLAANLTNSGHPSMCLDANSNNYPANGDNIQLWSCNTHPEQRWTLTSSGQLKNASTGSCLDANSKNYPANGDNIQLWSCNTHPEQRWKL